ncbi:GntR family transcriptional regulator [Mahella sp.]|uniref:GntR family transcriptional regulator n=1 Tax=Mahella sp. TaxID=2798721 RepID=UPI0025C6D9D3|nr:GntR family transcriptional regulator [Mahella sp.]MBZ4665423.1 GntR family transcriptional regulator [Mahella sp.]
MDELNRKKNIPKYLAISDKLQEEIKHKYRSGDRLPSEADLCSRFNANRYVVRQALARLVQLGLIRSSQGIGYFINEKPIDIRYTMTPITQYSEIIRQAGRKPGAELLSQQLLIPSRDVAEALCLSQGQQAYKLEILRYADGVRLTYSVSWLPEYIFPDFSAHTEGFSSLYDIFKTVYGIHPLRMRSTLRAIYPTASEALHLQISPSTPLLQIESMVCDEQNRHVEYTVAKYRGDLCMVSIQFQ